VRADTAQIAAEKLVQLHCLAPGLPFDVEQLDGALLPVGRWRFVALPSGEAARPVTAQTSSPPSVEASAADPAPGPKGPTLAAIEEAVRSIGKAQEWLVGALGEITGGGFGLDECQNWLKETRFYVVQAERAIQYARDIRGGHGVTSPITSSTVLTAGELLGAVPPPVPIGPDVDMLRAAVLGAAVDLRQRSEALVQNGSLFSVGLASDLGDSCRLYERALNTLVPFEDARYADESTSADVRRAVELFRDAGFTVEVTRKVRPGQVGFAFGLTFWVVAEGEDVAVKETAAAVVVNYLETAAAKLRAGLAWST
jgi:hypothetical protein